MTKNQQVRQAEINRHANNTIDDGRFGRVFELECARANSRKVRVSKQGQNDCYTVFENENGKRYAVPFECKTNGGRIGDIIARVDSGKDGFIVYQLDYTASTTKNKRRYVPAVIMPMSLFVSMLRECNAIKAVNKNGVQVDWAVQPSSKKMYLRLLDYPIPFDTETVYTLSDFEDLEI